MLRIAVCDDMDIICSDLENIILDFQKQERIKLTIDTFLSGETFIDYMKSGNKYDLIFLDIEIGKINGVEVGHYVRDELKDYIAKIVYISSKTGYDRQLFDVQPFNFLPKPLNKNKVVGVVRLAARLLETENNIFSFKTGTHTHRLPFRDIIYFENLGRKIKLVSINDTFYFYGTFDSIIEQLPKSRFVMPHRSYIVNYENSQDIKKDVIKTCNGDIIPISRLKAKEVHEFQIAYEEENGL